MRCSPFRPRCNRRGAVVVEMAVLLPFMVFIFLMTVDFCRIFYVTQTLQSCAYSGALYGSQVAGSSSGAQAAAQAAAVAEGTTLNPALTDNQVTYSPPDANNNIKVTVTYPFKTLTPLPGFSLTTNLSRSVTMVVAP
jgi:Flp pilus assembly protein TadG